MQDDIPHKKVPASSNIKTENQTKEVSLLEKEEKKEEKPKGENNNYRHNSDSLHNMKKMVPGTLKGSGMQQDKFKRKIGNFTPVQRKQNHPRIFFPTAQSRWIDCCGLSCRHEPQHH